MYSGITKGLFSVITVAKKPGLISYTVKLNKTLSKNLHVGDSVSIDGVCQTVTAIRNTNVSFQAIDETLKKTTLNDLFKNRQVSVERSLRVGDEIGGHLMAGHIFETGKIISRKQTKNNLSLEIKCSAKGIQFIFEKGFIGLDGSSLTVGKVNFKKCTFMVYLIPETLRVTNFVNKKLQERVNIELDPQAKMLVETMMRLLKKK